MLPVVSFMTDRSSKSGGLFSCVISSMVWYGNPRDRPSKKFPFIDLLFFLPPPSGNFGPCAVNIRGSINWRAMSYHYLHCVSPCDNLTLSAIPHHLLVSLIPFSCHWSHTVIRCTVCCAPRVSPPCGQCVARISPSVLQL